MKNKEKILFSIIRSALGTGEAVDSLQMTEKQWFSLYELTKEHGVSALVFDEVTLHKNNIPINLKIQWAFHTENIKKIYKKQLLATLHLSELLGKNGMRMMILKGNCLALNYPHPECRECGDIDIYCFGAYDAVNQLVKDNGIVIDHETAKHTSFYFEGVSIENHWKMTDDINYANRLINNEFVKNFDKNPLTDERIPGVYFPNLDTNALYIIQHRVNHLSWSGTPLRSLIDWMLFLMKNHENLDWSYLEKVWKETKETEILSILTKICIDNLGMPKECYGIDIQCSKRNYNEIYHQIFNPCKRPAATKNLIRKLYRQIVQYRSRKRAYYIIFKEPMSYSFFKDVLTPMIRRQIRRK